MLTWEGYGNWRVSYPEHVLTWEGYGNWRVRYPEHVLTWEGYGNWRVRSFVCVFVTFNS